MAAIKKKSNAKKLMQLHEGLIHSEKMKVVSHVQREVAEGFMNTLMVDGCDVPFKYLRTQKYKSVVGQLVNLTYYPSIDFVAGMEFEMMKVVRIKIA